MDRYGVVGKTFRDSQDRLWTVLAVWELNSQYVLMATDGHGQVLRRAGDVARAIELQEASA